MHSMEDILQRYHALLRLLDEDEKRIAECLDGDLKEVYCAVLRKEKQAIKMYVYQNRNEIKET